MTEATDGDRRLDGWKAISGHFNRDRSTVMRWAQQRNLPVHRVPGGKQGSVFALESELEAWFAQRGTAPDEVQTPVDLASGVPPVSSSLSSRRGITVGLAALLGVLLVVLLLIGATTLTATGPAKADLPSDQRAAETYLAARDRWAKRTPDDLRSAIGLYQKVIAADPNFAPAYAGMAEAWLVFREYGEVGDTEAYNAAHTAALRAMALDPKLPAAHRAMGFIHYWRENDAQRAMVAFQRALELDTKDAQTHFWFANVLSDFGDHEAARAHYDRARLLAPGSQVIEVESACAEWQAGRDASALERLNSLAARYPTDATVHNCLAWLHIGQGDITRFAKAYSAFAQARNDTALVARAGRLTQAVREGDRQAYRIVTQDMREELAIGERRGRETPAFYASGMGDRQELLIWLQEARAAGEIWYSVGITSRIAARWKDDAEIMGLLTVVGAPQPLVAAP
jgi:tetratricopeptide (TPR) repeat protein